jgi:hypothetical protein
MMRKESGQVSYSEVIKYNQILQRRNIRFPWEASKRSHITGLTFAFFFWG